MGRTIAIGDIHGCAAALDRLLHAIRPTADDTIIGMGDYVDRGMESSAVIEIMINLVSICRLVPLIGNHEIMMFKGLHGEPKDFDFWFQHGGNSTVASYGGRPQNIPEHHLSFLSHCVRYYETDDFFFVHANYDAELPLAEQPDELMFWQHVGKYTPRRHYSGKTAIVGHTPQVEGDVLNLGHIRVVDTFCYGDQWLSAHDVHTGQIWQANNAGDCREVMLGDVVEMPFMDDYEYTEDDMGDYPTDEYLRDQFGS